jgi:hypothetical protein
MRWFGDGRYLESTPDPFVFLQLGVSSRKPGGTDPRAFVMRRRRFGHLLRTKG